MAEKQKQKKKGEDNGGNKKGEDGGKKKEEKETPPVTVILKVGMHCHGCASKFFRCLQPFQGVESLKAESECGNLTITGKVDPSKLREKLANNVKNKLNPISPNSKSNNNKPQDKKPKEPPVTTVVLKVALHCQGCIDRIRKTVLKTKGVQDLVIDKDKETVTVKGTMEAKALVGNLKERLRRKVEVVPPKKESGDKEGKADNKEGNAGAKKKKGDGSGSGGGGGGGDNVKDDHDKGKMKQTRMEPLQPAYAPVYGYGYGPYGYGGDYNYGPVYMEQLHAPQMFSDENPNACSIM